MTLTPTPAATRTLRPILRTEARLFTREPGWLFWIVVFPTLLLVVLGLIPSFREHKADLDGQSVVALYAPVAVLLAGLMAGVQAMPTVLTTYREQRVLRRYRVTPASPTALLGAQAALHGAAILVSAALVLVVGRLAFGIGLPADPVGYLLALVLLLAVVLAQGAVITAVSSTLKVAQAVATVLFFPSMFTAGVWLPVQTMPDVMRRIVLCTPMGAGARALNDATTGAVPHLLDLLVMAGWAGALGLLAVRLFRWE